MLKGKQRVVSVTTWSTNLPIPDIAATLHRKSTSAFAHTPSDYITASRWGGYRMAMWYIRGDRLEIMWPKFKSQPGYFPTPDSNCFSTYLAGCTENKISLLLLPWARAQCLDSKTRPSPTTPGQAYNASSQNSTVLRFSLKISLTGSPLSTVFLWKTMCQLLPWQFHLLRLKLILT